MERQRLETEVSRPRRKSRGVETEIRDRDVEREIRDRHVDSGS